MRAHRHAVPAARHDHLVTTESGGDVLVYDLQVDRIHHLNPLAATVWRLCDGTRSIGEITTAAQEQEPTATEAAVRVGLTQLATAGLLVGPLDESLRVAGTSRRKLLQMAAAMAVPAVASVSAPTAAKASSTCLSPGSICDPDWSDDPCCGVCQEAYITPRVKAGRCYGYRM